MILAKEILIPAFAKREWRHCSSEPQRKFFCQLSSLWLVSAKKYFVLVGFAAPVGFSVKLPHVTV